MKDPRFIEFGGDRDRDADINRVVAIQCSYSQYLDRLNQGQLFDGEICTTSDQHRVYKGAKFVGPVVYHGTVADEAEMLALLSSSRGYERGDWCHRADKDGARWTCIAAPRVKVDGRWVPSASAGQWMQDTPASLVEGGAGQYFPVGNNDSGWVFYDDGNPVYEWFNYSEF